MRQGAIELTSQEAMESLSRFTSGIRVKSLNQLLILSYWLAAQYKHGPLYDAYTASLVGNQQSSFSGFVASLDAEDIAPFMGCGKRKSWEYLATVKKLVTLFGA